MKLLKSCLVMLLFLGAVKGLFAERAKEPYRAMLYSALLPGGGQIYNEAYVKAGLVMGVQGFLIGSAIYHEGKRADYQKLMDSTADAIQQQQYRSLRNEYKDRLNNDFWWIGITAALSIVDAYVDANLYDFEARKQKLNLRFEGTSINLELDF
ncbi:MAG: DUF5683 domain-containing protein [Candidatus Cloacimonadaceae bacterium]|nr:DUF5683 domain-containing protein [Candidatus Cloacimonadaceae bacterium]